jgi:TolB-like protein/Tfp pilus assembly protein PilF
MSILNELKRRNVFRVAAAYIVVGWILVEVATTLLPTFGAPPWVARVLVVVIALGFVPVVIFSWVYELTPQGLRKESKVAPGSSIAPETGRKLDLITIAAVVIGVGFLGLSRFVAAPSPAAPDGEVVATIDDASVAELPFLTTSGNPDNEYISAGLTETLLHMLAQVPELKVAARTSSFAFKGEQQDVRAIADALNVAHVLEGSVQRAGDKVRITAQLIRADDGFHVWSENYDRTLEDIFYIQDEIAEEVSSALTSSLFPEARVATEIVSVDTESIGAYEAYLQALGFVATNSYASLADSEQALKRALALDPGFQDARKLLAFTYLRQANTGLMRGDESWRRASALLDEVIADRPDDSEAQALALVSDINYEVQFGNPAAGYEAIPALREILSRSAGETYARVQLARTLATFKQMDEAETHFAILLETDALNPQLHWLLGESRLDNDRVEAARQPLQRSAELQPGNPNVWASLADLDRRLGNAVGFVQNYRRAIEVDPEDNELVSVVADDLYRYGLIEQGDVFLRRASAIAPSHPMTRASRLHRSFFAGDFEQTVTDARQAIADDIENRHGAYTAAVQYFSELSVTAGDAESAYLFLENNAPAVNHPERRDSGLKYLFAQSFVFPLWYAALPDEQAAAKAARWEESLRSLGFAESDAPHEFIDIYLLRGDRGKAVELALTEIFAQPAATFPDWEAWLARRHMAPLAADARLAPAIERYTADSARARGELVDYFTRYPAD